MSEGYANPIAGASGALVRDKLQSRNYVPATAGWMVAADGDAEFNDVTVRGTLESGNYVPGVSGWRLAESGAAELYDLTARGDLRSDNYVVNVAGWMLDDTGSAEFNNITARGSITSDALSASGDVVFGTSSNDTHVDIRNDETFSVLSQAPPLGIGRDFQGKDLMVFSDRIQARTHVLPAGYSATTLRLQPAGGSLVMGSGTFFASGFEADAVSADTLTSFASADIGTTLITGGNVNIGGDLDVLGGDARIAGNMDCQAPTAGTTANCNLNTTGGFERLRKNTSSLRYKGNVTDAAIDLDAVLALRPRTFTRNDDRDPLTDEILPMREDGPRYVGFIAEEADALGLTGWVVRENKLDPATGETKNVVDGFGYDLFVVAHQAVLRQHEGRIADLEAQLSALK